jgi:hypothetical protein
LWSAMLVDVFQAVAGKLEGDQIWIIEDEHQGETIPEYLWFKFPGKPGVHDFGMTHIKGGFPLIVSDKASNVLKKFKLQNCRIKDFDQSMICTLPVVMD